MSKRILFIDNTAHHLFTQRHLYNAFTQQGHQIMLCCPDDGDYFKKIQNHGYECTHLNIDGKGLNPIKNLKLIYGLYKVIKHSNAEIVLSFTIKPNIFCALASKKLKIPVVPNVTGLGYIFLKSGLLTKLISKLYKYAFSHLEYIIFQNYDDKQVFVDMNMLSNKTQCIQVPGSGVNLQKFPFIGYTNTDNETITFLYIGRLLWDKGIGELIDAYRVVKVRYPQTRLVFIGNYFLANPSAIKPKQMLTWQNDLGIEYMGMVENVSEIIAQCDCVVLPSYREGMPRAILEGSSMGKPVITTDTAGCRDALDNNITGFLCNVKDTESLTEKMLEFIELPLIQKQQMGIAGRRKMEQEFDQGIVVSKYEEILQKLFKQKR